MEEYGKPLLYLALYGLVPYLLKEGLKVAKLNAKIQHLENRCKFYKADIDNISSSKYDLGFFSNGRKISLGIRLKAFKIWSSTILLVIN